VTPIRLERNIAKTAGECYLATIVDYWIICCEAIRSAILATVWLLVHNPNGNAKWLKIRKMTQGSAFLDARKWLIRTEVYVENKVLARKL